MVLRMSKSKKNKALPREKIDSHCLDYGLQKKEVDPNTHAVKSLLCRFCMRFGRESKKRKRAPTSNNQVWQEGNFRTDNYKAHMDLVHPKKFKEYSDCSADEKKVFFDKHPGSTPSVMKYLDTERPMILTFNRDVVDTLIGGILFDPDDEEAQKPRERALKIFKPIVAPVEGQTGGEERGGQPPPLEGANDGEAGDEDLNLEAYQVEIKRVKRFKIVKEFIAAGASFRSASRFVDIARNVCDQGDLAGCSEGVCAEYVRIICACSYQALSEILSTCWGYSIALDVGSAQGQSYIVLRVRFCVAGGLFNAHVIAVPLRTNKKAETQFKLCATVLDVLDKKWRNKLISIGTDGEPTMTGHVQGVQTLFQRAAKYEITRVWCGLHQLDLVAQREYSSLYGDTFTKALVKLITHLRQQIKLQMEMQATCPKFVDTRWLSMSRITKWLKKHRVRVFEHLKVATSAPDVPPEWWILVMCLDTVAQILGKTFRSLQGLTTLLANQEAQLKGLIVSLNELCKIEGPHQERELARLKPTEHVIKGEYSVALADAHDYINDQGLYVQGAYRKLQEDAPEEVDQIKRDVAGLFLGLFLGITEVVAVRDSNNRGLLKDLPPVLPHALAKTRAGPFCEFIRANKGRLQNAGWTEEDMEQISTDHQNLRVAYTSERQFKVALDQCTDAETGFEKGWALCNGRFEKLKLFAGGLASMFPNTATVEADFSLIGVEKPSNRTSLTDFSLEGVLHAKQLNKLRTICNQD